MTTTYENSSEKCIFCKECSILTKRKPIHCYLDYLDFDSVDILFISDSPKWTYAGGDIIDSESFKLLDETLKEIGIKNSWYITPAIKCPNVVEKTISTKDLSLCRNYLIESVKQFKPKLILPMGNLALKTLIKKSGINDKRGTAFEYESIPVVPIYHPFAVIKEPRLKALFVQDIRNAYNTFIIKQEVKDEVDYILVDNVDWFDNEIFQRLVEENKPIAVDIETTGLNWRKEKILTIAVSWDKGKVFCIPIYHKETNWTKEELKYIISCLKILLEDNRIKIFHNAKFDCKFLNQIGIKVKNIWDTQLMYHMIDENAPKRLIDLVNRFFPEKLGVM